MLEDRTLFAVRVWTGNLVPDTRVGGPGNPFWSAAGNWVPVPGEPSQIPTNGDDVIFPLGVPAGNKVAPIMQPGTGRSTNFTPFNSWNDIPNLVLNSITIQDSGFVIGGGNNTPGARSNIILLSSFAADANFTSGASQWSIALGLSAPLRSFRVENANATVNLVPGGPITFGELPGSPFIIVPPMPMPQPMIASTASLTDATPNAGIIKLGPGTLTLGGGNSYTGLTEVTQGILTALGSNTALGASTSGTVVRRGATLRLTPAGLVPLTIANETLELEIPGDGFGGIGALQATAGGATNTSIWNGPISLIGTDPSGSATLSVNPNATFQVTGTISGNYGLTKIGTGTLVLTRDNSYAGTTLVNQGILNIRTGSALGLTSAGTTVAAGATLQAQGGTFTVAEPLTLNGPGLGNNGALQSFGGAPTNVTWVGPITLASNTSIGGDLNSRLTIAGSLAGAPNLTKVGPNTLIITSGNAGFTGGTVINGGTVNIQNPLALGPTMGGGAIVVNIDGTLQVQGQFTLTKPITLNGIGFSTSSALQATGATTVVDWAGPITLGSTTAVGTELGNTLTISGAITGPVSATLEKGGDGTLVLPNANPNFLGPFTLRQGFVIIQNGQALGGPSGGATTVAAGATLQLAPGLTVPNEGLILNGIGVAVPPLGNVGALRLVGGDNVWGGNVSLSGTPPLWINLETPTTRLTFSGVLSGGTDATKRGPGILVLSGTASNTHLGALIVTEGTLLLNKTGGAVAIAGTLVIGDSAGGPGADLVQLLGPNQIADNAFVNLTSSGRLDLNGFSDTIGPLTSAGGTVTTAGAAATGTLTLGGGVNAGPAAAPALQPTVINGRLDLGTGTLSRVFNIAFNGALANDVIINAVISGPAGVGLTKTGTGRLLLGAANTYQGPTLVQQGILRLGANNGVPAASALIVTGAATEFDLNNFNDTVGSLAGDGIIRFGSGVLTAGRDNSSTTFSGQLLNAPVGTGGLTKEGTGTLTLTANNAAFTGATRVTAGTLLVNGNLSSSVVTATTGGILGGNGTVGPIISTGGRVSPGGTSAGRLNVNGNVTLDDQSALLIDLNGLTPGIQYDQLVSNGIISLGNAALIRSTTFNSNLGDQFDIVQVTGALGTITNSTFNGLPDGATFSLNGRIMQINYTTTRVRLTTILFETATSLNLAPSPSVFGQPVQMTATVAAVGAGVGTPSGMVTFVDTTTNTLLGTASLNAFGQATITVSDLLTGTHAIRATYLGVPNLFAGSTVLRDQVVNRAATLTSVTTSLATSSVNQPVTFTATVTALPPGAGTPTGLVTFVDTTTGTMLGGGNLVMGQVAITVQNLAAGMHTITATYAGDSNFEGSGGSRTQTVTTTNTTTMVEGMPNPSNFNQPVTIMATVLPNLAGPLRPTGNVTFVDQTTMSNLGTVALSGSGVATLVLSTLSAGGHLITATYNGDSNFNTSTAQYNQTVNRGGTVTTVGTSLNPSVFGQPVTFTANVAPMLASTSLPTGSVTFIDTTTSITLGTVDLSPAGQAVLTVSDLTVGAHAIRATYNGDANYAPSNGLLMPVQQVNQAPTLTTVSSSGSPSVFGQSVTFTATINPAPSIAVPSGSVVFVIDGTPSAPVMVDAAGQASLTINSLALGNHTIQAQYTSNNPGFASSTSAAIPQQVNQAPTQTLLFTTSNPALVGQNVSFIAVVSPAPGTLTATGSVTFFVDNVFAGTFALNNFGQAVLSTAGLRAGRHTVRAVYTSNSPNFAGSSSTTLTQVISIVNLQVVGVASGAGPHVKAYTTNGTLRFSFFAYDPAYLGGVRVASADVTGDGVADIITGTGFGAGPHIKVFDGNTGATVRSFFAYDASFLGGVWVAGGDINADGFADILVGPDQGPPNVRVFDGRTNAILRNFFAYAPTFLGGARVTAADLNGDGFQDILTVAGPGGNGHVIGFSGQNNAVLTSFFAADPSTTQNLFIAAGDFFGQGRADILVGPGPVSLPLVRIFDGLTGQVKQSFFAFDPAFRGGVTVGAADLNLDGRTDLILGAGPGGNATVKALSGGTLQELEGFFAFPGFPGAIFVGGSK
jgi:autotransporter-associated beta strand protein